MAKKSIIIFVLCSIFSSTSIFSQEPLIDFQYWDTFSFQDDGFVAQHTYLEDINNHGVMVGRFINESGNTEAFVFYENFKMIRYSHPGYAHTEFLGINDNGIIIGAAYDITTNRLPIYIKLVDASSSTPSYNSTYVYKNELQTPAIEMNFGYVGGDNRYPQKISNFNNLAVGTVNTATVGRWLHYIEYDAPEYGGESIIYSISSPFTSYSTYGLSLNNEGKLACGFYIDGANNFPYIYDMEEEEFYTETAGLPSANRVKFNDINNSEYVAFTFRNTSGVWVAGLAKREYSIFSGYYFTDYATFPFKNTTFGSSCTGINDDNDVVGYYSISSDRTVAFFAVTHEWKIPDFDFNTDRFSFKRSEERV